MPSPGATPWHADREPVRISESPRSARRDGSRRLHYQVTFAVLALGVPTSALPQPLVIPVLTTVQHELHTSQDAVTWVLARGGYPRGSRSSRSASTAAKPSGE